jgi:hypothetical protein
MGKGDRRNSGKMIKRRSRARFKKRLARRRAGESPKRAVQSLSARARRPPEPREAPAAPEAEAAEPAAPAEE